MVRLLLITWLTACYVPIKVSPECEKRISDCLKNCKIGGPEPDPPIVKGDDPRTYCEQRCHELCT